MKKLGKQCQKKPYEVWVMPWEGNGMSEDDNLTDKVNMHWSKPLNIAYWSIMGK